MGQTDSYPYFPISPAFFEFCNFILIVVLPIMLGFAVLHLWHIWNECRLDFPGKGGWWRCVRGIYWQRKPSIAITLFLTGILVRFMNLAHLQYLSNHKLPLGFFAIHSEPIFAGSYVMVIWAAICWIRNISPFPILNWHWVLVLSGTVIFATIMTWGG